MFKAHNETIESDRRKLVELVKVAGFDGLKEFSEVEGLGLKYSSVLAWGKDKIRSGVNNGKLRPVPVWVFSWLELYIKDKKSTFKNDEELLRENTILKERMNAVYKIVSVDKD